MNEKKYICKTNKKNKMNEKQVKINLKKNVKMKYKI